MYIPKTTRLQERKPGEATVVPGWPVPTFASTWCRQAGIVCVHVSIVLSVVVRAGGSLLRPCRGCPAAAWSPARRRRPHRSRGQEKEGKRKIVEASAWIVEGCGWSGKPFAFGGTHSDEEGDHVPQRRRSLLTAVAELHLIVGENSCGA